jgi:hypothetical protein
LLGACEGRVLQTQAWDKATMRIWTTKALKRLEYYRSTPLSDLTVVQFMLTEFPGEYFSVASLEYAAQKYEMPPRLRRKKRAITSPWKEPLEKELALLWDQGFTTRQIGAKLHVSRNAVIGKRFRMKLKSRPSPIKKRLTEADNFRLAEQAMKVEMVKT